MSTKRNTAQAPGRSSQRRIGANQCAPLGLRHDDARRAPGADRQRGEQRRGGEEHSRPADQRREQDQGAAAGDQRDPIGGDAHAVGVALLAAVDQADRVGVDGDVLGRRRQGDRQQDRPEPERRYGWGRTTACRRVNTRQGQQTAGDPLAPLAEAVDQRRPDDLQRPRQPEQRRQADVGERHAAHLEVHRHDLLDDAERQPLGEVQERDPGELAPQRHEGADSSCSARDSQMEGDARRLASRVAAFPIERRRVPAGARNVQR